MSELTDGDEKKSCELCPRVWMVDDDHEYMIRSIMNKWVCAVPDTERKTGREKCVITNHRSLSRSLPFFFIAAAAELIMAAVE